MNSIKGGFGSRRGAACWKPADCDARPLLQDGCAVTRWRQALAGAERWMLDQREIWEQRLDRMQDYVEGLATNKEKP